MANRPARIKRSSLADSLSACGLVLGDTALVHSDLFAMGPVEGNQEDMLPTYYQGFWDVLGEDGTLVVPGYFYEYGRWQTPYDTKRSPVSSELGIFSQYVNNQTGRFRSLNPLTALTAIGGKGQYLCGGGTGSAYGVDSPWDRLLSCNGKIIFVGVDLQVMTFVHFVEHMVGVPHLYSKFFAVPVLEDGQPVDISIYSQVRYLDFDVEYNLEGLTSEFESANILQTAEVGRGKIRCVTARDAFDFLKDKLKQDPFYLLTQPPKFVAGQIPMDGAAGPARA